MDDHIPYWAVCAVAVTQSAPTDGVWCSGTSLVQLHTGMSSACGSASPHMSHPLSAQIFSLKRWQNKRHILMNSLCYLKVNNAQNHLLKSVLHNYKETSFMPGNWSPPVVSGIQGCLQHLASKLCWELKRNPWFKFSQKTCFSVWKY